ncbi:MAG TPA: cell division protein FtsA, partial [Flavisolibacter sp.]|nr:cell division protein FtsA [Flavisolibacter sp.]
FEQSFKPVVVPEGLRTEMEEDPVEVETNGSIATGERRRSMTNFWGKFKDGLINIFKEEEDHRL